MVIELIWRCQKEATGMNIVYSFNEHEFYNYSDYFKPAEMVQYMIDHHNYESVLFEKELGEALEDYYKHTNIVRKGE